jgi:succinate dehydrogenase / fumarate reductase, membrane anchor subunit
MSHKSSLRTPLGKVRGLGSAKAGTEHFWRQRLTGLANIPLTIAFILLIIALTGAPYASAMQTLGSAPVAILMGLFLLVGLYHMKLGMQVIIEDYVHGERTKILALIANTFFVILIGAICAYALFVLSFTDTLSKG